MLRCINSKNKRTIISCNIVLYSIYRLCVGRFFCFNLFLTTCNKQQHKHCTKQMACRENLFHDKMIWLKNDTRPGKSSARCISRLASFVILLPEDLQENYVFKIVYGIKKRSRRKLDKIHCFCKQVQDINVKEINCRI